MWDGDQLVLEQTGNTVKKYIRGLNLAAQQDGSGLTYYLYNAHGDVVQLCSADGAIIQSYDYDAFGVEKSSSAANANPFRYCGEYYDGETETYYLRARNYAPTLGRFTQRDTYTGNYSNSLSLNLYTYCGNNPVRYGDPSGHYYTQRHITTDWENQFHNRAAAWLHSWLGNEDREDREIELWYNVAIDVIADAVGTPQYQSPADVPDEEIDRRFLKALEERKIVVTTVTSVFAEAASQAVTKQVRTKLTAFLGKDNRPQTLNINKGQLGKKWGKHRSDYPMLGSYQDYLDLAIEVFENPDEIRCGYATGAQEHFEYFYVKGADVVRVKPDGTFVSMYPGLKSSIVQNSTVIFKK